MVCDAMKPLAPVTTTSEPDSMGVFVAWGILAGEDDPRDESCTEQTLPIEEIACYVSRVLKW